MKRLIGFLAVTLGTSAFGMEVTCPASVSVSEQAKQAPAGWEGFQPDSAHPFERVSLYFHHPREMGSLVPDNEGSKQPPRWSFVGGKSGEYWVACLYAGTDTALVKQLPPGLHECSATTGGVRCK